MAKRKSKSGGTKGRAQPRKASRKVGSNPKAAKRFARDNDFGVPESRALTDQAKRVSREAKFQPAASHHRDPRQERGSTQSARASGVGKSNAGPGGASAGDIDTDIVGVGAGEGLSQSGPDADVSPAESSTGGSEEFASGPPAKGENQNGRRHRRRGQ
jgi:hypothetical protein